MRFAVRPYQPGDLAALIPMVKQALEFNDLTPDAFARDFLMAPGFRAEHLLVAVSEEPFVVLGFVLAPRQDPLAPPDRGFIAAFGVDPRFQRRGIGRALVARAVADMRAEGLREIDVADVPVRYVVPGIDRARFPAAYDLLTDAGFAARDAVASMGIDASAVHRPAGQGIPEPMRLIGPEDVHLLHDFLVPEFDPAWWAYFEASLRLRFSGDHSPSEIICWMEEGKPLGAVHFRGTRFGPVAVGAAARGRGIGANLTLGVIDRMRTLGYRSVYFMMATAEVEPFYAKLGIHRAAPVHAIEAGA